jgi:branched-chain amino acid transport system permease protein
MTTDRQATLFTDPPSIKPPIWTFPLRAGWPIALAILAAALIYFQIVPHIGGFGAELLANCGIAIIVAVSLTVVNGFTGQFSIGHAGFLSLGGYVAAAIVYYGSYRIYGDFNFHGGKLSWTDAGTAPVRFFESGDVLFVGACLCGAIVAGAIGWLVGLPSLRLRGDYLAIVTLGFGEIVRVLIQGTGDQLDASSTDPAIRDLSFPRLLVPLPTSWQFWHSSNWTSPKLGGALGFSGAPTYSTTFWIWLVAILTLAATIRLKYSGYGRALLSIREDDIAAQAVGVNITKLKVRAFVYSAFFAGLAGGLYSLKIGTINAGELGFQRSFDFVIMVVLGGLGSISGAAIAAIILTLLPELLRAPPDLFPWGWIVPAGIAALILAFAPRRIGPLITLISVCIGWEAMRHIAIKAHIDLSQYRMVIYALTLIVIMIVRPQGLFGLREVWDYLPMRRRQT